MLDIPVTHFKKVLNKEFIKDYYYVNGTDLSYQSGDGKISVLERKTKTPLISIYDRKKRPLHSKTLFKMMLGDNNKEYIPKVSETFIMQHVGPCTHHRPKIAVTKGKDSKGNTVFTIDKKGDGRFDILLDNAIVVDIDREYNINCYQIVSINNTLKAVWLYYIKGSHCHGSYTDEWFHDVYMKMRYYDIFAHLHEDDYYCRTVYRTKDSKFFAD